MVTKVTSLKARSELYSCNIETTNFSEQTEEIFGNERVKEINTNGAPTTQTSTRQIRL